MSSTVLRQVPYVNFKAQYAAEKDVLLAAVTRTMASGQYILGPEVERFEKKLAEFCGVKHAIGVSSGTAALVLGLKILGVEPGDEVIVPPNSFVASATAAVLLGAKPVFADVREDLNIDPQAIEKVITARSKVIMPVHLTGRMADMDAITQVAQAHGLKILEDAAQAIGATWDGKKAGAWGHAAAFSMHPLKNLNAMGDAGAITTHDDGLAARLRVLRNLGLKNRDEVVEWSDNMRLDELQAAILNVRLERLTDVTEKRRAHAQRYRERLGDVAGLRCPQDAPQCYAVYHVFIIQCEQRDALQKFLMEQGIETKIHYPIPIHRQPCAAKLGYATGSFPVAEAQARQILSLPIHQHLEIADIDYVSAKIRKFFGAQA